MSLGWKIFFTYLGVAAVGLLVLALSVAFVAPITFSRHVDMMPYMQERMSHMQSENAEPGLRWNVSIQVIEEDLEATFRQAVNDALFRAALAATLAAGIVSWFTSRHIVRPIRELSLASQHIAEGHYDQRLAPREDDELGELIHSFNRMAAALAETETMRQQLMADVSHELKTPLASIKGYMEGLQDGVIPAVPETFQLVHREADRLQRLVRDLQELSRTEAAALQLEMQPCVPEALVEAVTARLQPQFTDKRVTLENACPAGLPPVWADPDRAEQVLTNLLGNALQYTPPGGQVAVHLTQVDSMVQFSIQDTGVGLLPEDLTRVFQRFYRADKSRARASGGSGIGLTIARHIVEAHHGRIWAESPGLNQGSTFTFTLPLAQTS